MCLCEYVQISCITMVWTHCMCTMIFGPPISWPHFKCSYCKDCFSLKSNYLCCGTSYATPDFLIDIADWAVPVTQVSWTVYWCCPISYSIPLFHFHIPAQWWATTQVALNQSEYLNQLWVITVKHVKRKRAHWYYIGKAMHFAMCTILPAYSHGFRLLFVHLALVLQVSLRIRQLNSGNRWKVWSGSLSLRTGQGKA